eukprot:1005721-Pleurochrysis_carterae.AAC.3
MYKSVRIEFTRPELFCPRKRSAVRGFSKSLGSRFDRMRLPRAVFARFASILLSLSVLLLPAAAVVALLG